jgi:7-carboxy-7-deazaguanine synthase
MAPGGSETLTPHELFDRVFDSGNGVEACCLTGGEPFLQRNAELQEFVDLCSMAGFKMECFSNGSFIYPDWALLKLQFIMDWKLQGSGEGDTALQERLINAVHLKRSDHIKFVVMDNSDLEEAAGEFLHLQSRGVSAQFWVGAAWDQIDTQSIVDFVISNNLPWYVNVQMHKYLWDPDARKV